MTSLWDHLAHRGAAMSGEFHGRSASVALAELTTGSTLKGKLESLRGRSILIATHEQLPTALALLELDGVARRIVLCTPDLTPEQLTHIARSAAADAVIVDAESTTVPTITPYPVTARPAPQKTERRTSELTEWVLLTSGTTGMPKLVLHNLESLAGTLPRQAPTGRRCVWSTFYDIRRYGGLQIYLRAVLSGAPLVLSYPGESTRDFFTRAAAQGVTHISGTPTHWRRALMSGDAALLTPDYVRLSGEVADQAVLDALRAAYPNAQIAHAFASTEAGVAFDVNDGLAGFPADFLGKHGAIDLKVQDGTLRIRSHRTAARYLGDAPGGIAGSEGYVDTGDLVELEGGRYHFRGRTGGVINVGGLKVYPEEVESVLNADPRVRMSLVRARRNPITGAVVIAEVVLADGPPTLDTDATERLKTDLLNACRRALPAHKVPAALRLVAELETTAAGKLVRPGA
jgi:acyl-coenzyme A synthetase/AMP-(fatty) acid ligase